MLALYHKAFIQPFLLMARICGIKSPSLLIDPSLFSNSRIEKSSVPTSLKDPFNVNVTHGKVPIIVIVD